MAGFPANPVQTAITLPAVINDGGFGAVINESKLRFTPFSGGEISGKYEGPDEDIQPLIQVLFNFGYEVIYTKSKSAISTLEFRAAWSVGSGGGNVPVNPNVDFQDTWELVRNTTQKELLESDHPLIGFIGAGNLQILKNLITGSGPDKWSGDPTTTFNNNPSSDYDASVYLFSLFQSGVKTIPVKQPILKLTRTTNPLYSAPFNVSNVDTILTTQSMLSESGVPSSFAIPLINLAQNLVDKTKLVPGTLQMKRMDGLVIWFGWKKDLISNTKHGNKRIQYILQYEAGFWDALTWGTPQ